MGHLYHPQGSWTTTEEEVEVCKSQRLGRSGAKPYLPYKTWSLHSWICSGCGCLHKIKPVSIPVWLKEQPTRTTPSRGSMDSWWLLRDRETDLFKDVAPCRYTRLQWMGPHIGIYGQRELRSVGSFFRGTEFAGVGWGIRMWWCSWEEELKKEQGVKNDKNTLYKILRELIQES